MSTDYVGRRRRYPACEHQFPGCETVGQEIIDPYEQDVEGVEEITVACPPCERQLSAET